MLWHEKGVEEDSYISFFDPGKEFKENYYYMYSCGYFHTNSAYSYASSKERAHLFCYIVNGTLNVMQNGETYQANQGDIVLLNCHEENAYACPSYCEFLFFHFDGPDATRMLTHYVSQNGSVVFQLENREEIFRTLYDPIMRLCYEEQARDKDLSVLVYSVLCMLEQHYSMTSSSHTAVSSSTEHVMQYVKTNIHAMPSLQELADVAMLSTYYFSHQFKEETGVSPIEYVARTKISYAKMMLKTSNATVQEIADSLGYSSSASFINAFKQRQGISPNQYRNLKR